MSFKCNRCRDSKIVGIISVVLNETKDYSSEELNLRECPDCSKKNINDNPYTPDDSDFSEGSLDD